MVRERRKSKMALAKKCDRCGKLYEAYSVEGDDRMNGITEANIEITGRWMIREVFDLCPECKRSFEKWRDNK